MITPLSIVKFDYSTMDATYHQYYKDLLEDSNVLFLGEIPQCPGHCAVVTKSGVIRWMLHTDNFVVVDREDC